MENSVMMRDPRKSNYYYEESIKTLRTNIQFSSKQVKTILLTSCYPNEGKSDVAFSLAMEMGKLGQKVLLIDADIRKSTFINKYRVNEAVNGLSQYLSGQVELQDIIYHTNFQNMDMIFAGPTAPNPSELLGDADFAELLRQKRDDYAYIFIDTPPAASLIDATVVAKNCDAGILVIESEAISYKAAQKVKTQIERSGCHLIGAVLNKVDMKKGRYYNSYKGYYKK